MQQTIYQLFTQYLSAFNSFNAQQIADHYTLPCAISDVDGNLVFSDKNELIQKFSNNCENMKTIGYINSEFNLLNETKMGLNSTAVTVGWRIILEKND